MKINHPIFFETAALSLLPTVIALLSSSGNGGAHIDILGANFKSLPLIEAAIFFGLLGLFSRFHSRVRLPALIAWAALCCALSMVTVVAVSWLVKDDMVVGYLEAGLILLNALAAVLAWLAIRFIASYCTRNKLRR
ncbi:hypothetical protein [Dyella koreensis]|uniref:Uncharacterized protein n=1 Tax=Dyella koreensis TaxID=311235 RepID=A0ABW8K4N4_9GAMM